MLLDQPASDPAREWHVLLSGERRGPYTREALFDVLDTHPAGWRSPVWRPGMLDWRPAREVAVLLQSATTATHVQRGVVLFPDAGSDPVLATPPIASGRVAPTSAPATRDLPAYKAPRPFWRRSVVAAIAGALVAIAGLLLLRLKLAPAPPAEPPLARMAPALPVPAVLPPPLPAREENASAANAPAEAEPAPEGLARAPVATPPAADRPTTPSEVKSVRVRARWAPVRTSGDPDAKVLCSLPRGAVVAVTAERPGTHLRWFAVRCDGDSEGWVHENFVRVRP